MEQAKNRGLEALVDKEKSVQLKERLSQEGGLNRPPEHEAGERQQKKEAVAPHEHALTVDPLPA